MKKNKKLFAILTLVAFMMTLMPVMAFAATPVNIIKIDVISGSGYISIIATRDTNKGAASAEVILENVNADNLELVGGITTASALKARAAYSDDLNIPVEFEDGSYTSNPRMVRVIDPDQDTVGSGSGIGAGAGTNIAPGAAPSLSDLEDAFDDSIDKGTPSNRKSVVTIVNGNDNGNASVEREENATEDKIIKTDANTVELQLVPRNAMEQIITGTLPMYIWVEEEGLPNQASDALVLSSLYGVPVVKQSNHVYKVMTNGVTSVYAQFVGSGKYTLKASFDTALDDTVAPNGKGQATFGGISKIISETGRNIITVTAPSVNTRNWGISVKYDNKIDGTFDNEITANPQNDFEAKYFTKFNTATTPVDVMLDGGRVGYINVAANTVATTPVTIDVYDLADATGVHNTVSKYPVKVSSGSANVELSKDGVVAGNDGLNLTTGYTGNVTFDVAGLREGEYKVYVTIGDYESTLIVKVGATAANDIQTIKFPSNPIATDTEANDYDGIFRIQLTDANGNIVVPQADGNLTRGANNATITNPNVDQAKYVAIVTAPEANKVRNADIYLRYVRDSQGKGKEYYTIGFNNGKKFEAEGDYEVRIVLDNGKSVNIPFTVKKFDKAVSLQIEYATEAVELNADVAAPDIYFLDANNVMKKANNRVTVAASGYAVAKVEQSGRDAGALKIKNDEKYLGQTITVSAVAEKENLVATTTLTVTDSAQSIKLDTNRGQVNVANRIGFKLVNSNGQAVALGSDTIIDDVTCVVTNVENPDAKVSFSVAGTTKSDLQNKGTGVVVLSSNKETTATVQIMVKASKADDRKGDNNNSVDNNTGLSTTYYTGIETFTFGAEADKSVVMTIGSKEIVANNVPATIDVAPFIKDNRTFVPFRALVEAFGAEVNYDEATSTVTTKLDGKTVVLTVGSTVLTVNDETVTMDVAPYIVNDRVVVPVRFVGEAFGFTVEATQDAETGATASVVFYQK